MQKLPSYDELFKDFTGRDEDLRKVTRYSLYKTMFYRSNLYTHGIRTAAIVRQINKNAAMVFDRSYDPFKAELLALVHDDAEIIFGDVQAGNKSKMTKKQLEEVRQAELDAIEKISKRFPVKLAGYYYKQLLLESESYSSLEAQIMNYADKYDALGEALHEIYAGNSVFAVNAINDYGKIPTPAEYFTKFFKEFADKFPDAKVLFDTNNPLLKIYNKTDYKKEAKSGKPHTEESIYQPASDPRYETWRNIITKIDHSEVIRDLYVQKEFQKL